MEKKAKDIFYESNWWEDTGGFFGKLYAEADDSYEGFLKKPQDMPVRIKQEIEGIERLCELKKGNVVLDCPCGYGRHSLGLAQKKYYVHGVDINSEHLGLAKQQAEKIKAEQCVFTQKDMRTLNFNNEFNAIINMFYSFGFFEKEEDDLLSIKNFYKALKPKGKFLMHTFITVPKIKAENYKKHDIRTLSSGNKLELFRDFDSKTKREVGEWSILRKDGKRDKLAPYSMRIYTTDEFEVLCRKAGFSKVSFYGDWEGNPYKNESELLIAVATK